VYKQPRYQDHQERFNEKNEEKVKAASKYPTINGNVIGIPNRISRKVSRAGFASGFLTLCAHN